MGTFNIEHFCREESSARNKYSIKPANSVGLSYGNTAVTKILGILKIVI